MNFGLAIQFQEQSLFNIFDPNLIQDYYQHLGQELTQEQAWDTLQNPKSNNVEITKAWKIFFPHEGISTFTKFGECHIKQRTYFNENRTSLEASFYFPVLLHENAVSGLCAVAMSHMTEEAMHEFSFYNCYFTENSWSMLLQNLKEIRDLIKSEYKLINPPFTLRINQSNLKAKQIVELEKISESINGLVLRDKNLDEVISTLGFKIFLENSPLKTFGLVTQELSEENLGNICQSLLNNKDLKHLFFKDNIHVKNIALIAGLVKEHLTIESLSLEGKGITEEALQILAQELQMRGKKISIRLADSEIDSRVMSAFIKTIGHKLDQIDLIGLPLQDLDIVLAAYSFENMTHLSLRNIDVHEDMVIGLTQKLAELKVEEIRKSPFQVSLTMGKVELSARDCLEMLAEGIYKLSFKEDSLKPEDHYMSLLKKIRSSPLSQELLEEVLSIEGLMENSNLIEDLLSKKFEVIHVEPKGDCLFSALQIVSGSLCQDGRMMRKELVDWIQNHSDEFKHFLQEIFDGQNMDVKMKEYCTKMREYYDPSKGINGTWGGELELRAMADYLVEKGLNQHIRVIDPCYELKIVNGEFETTLIYGNPQTEPLFVARVHQNHYIALKKLKDN